MGYIVASRHLHLHLHLLESISSQKAPNRSMVTQYDEIIVGQDSIGAPTCSYCLYLD